MWVQSLSLSKPISISRWLCLVQPSGACPSSWRDVDVLGCSGKTALSQWELLSPSYGPSPWENTEPLSSLKLERLNSVIKRVKWNASSRCGNKFWLGTPVLVVSVCFTSRQRVSLQFPIPAKHVWHYTPSELTAWHSLCSPLTPITAEDFAQLDTSSSHWVPCQHPLKSRGIWLLCLMRARRGSSATVEATCKGSQGTAGSRSPTLHDQISLSVCERGYRSYKHITTGNWGLQQDRQQFHFNGTLELDVTPRFIQESPATSCFKV